jgi:hypothetical protein
VTRIQMLIGIGGLFENDYTDVKRGDVCDVLALNACRVWLDSLPVRASARPV